MSLYEKKKETEESLRKFWSKELRDHEHFSVDLELKTIMFWNLQLQFMNMEALELSMMCDILKIRHSGSLKPYDEFRMELATNIALHLSGLA